jgi:hypothetical protein
MNMSTQSIIIEPSVIPIPTEQTLAFGNDRVSYHNSPDWVNFTSEPKNSRLTVTTGNMLTSEQSQIFQPENPPLVMVDPENNFNIISYRVNPHPWQSIIILIMGGIIAVYSAVAPGVDNNRRLFGVVLTLLWTAVWALILWVLWKEKQYTAAWWLLLVPTSLLLLFFVVIILLNIGGSL